MTDKLAEEILSDILFEHYMTKLGCMETSSGALGTFRSFKIWKEIVKAMQAYHEAKIREELIKYSNWTRNENFPADQKFIESVVDEYLKQVNP